jgi:hypothetical protein
VKRCRRITRRPRCVRRRFLSARGTCIPATKSRLARQASSAMRDLVRRPRVRPCSVTRWFTRPLASASNLRATASRAAPRSCRA